MLARGGTPAGLSDLEARLTRGFQAREALCQQAMALVPEDPGTRDLLVRVLGVVLTPLLEAVRALYTVKTEQAKGQKLIPFPAEESVIKAILKRS